VAKVIEHVRPRYEVQDVEFGKVYKWCPEHLVVECQCGEMTSLTASTTACEECGTEHTGLVREALPDHRLGEEDLHPWRYAKVSADDPLSWV
jgi:hypothetical protein